MQDWGCGLSAGCNQAQSKPPRLAQDGSRMHGERGLRIAGVVPVRLVSVPGRGASANYWNNNCPGLLEPDRLPTADSTRAHSCKPPRFLSTTQHAARRDSSCRLLLLSVPLCLRLRLPVDPVRNPPDDGHGHGHDQHHAPPTTTRHTHPHTGFPRSVDPSSAALGEGCLFDERDHP